MTVPLFKVGDRVTWNDDHVLPKHQIRVAASRFGKGPFTILRVHEVSPENQGGTLHPQQVIIKELVGFTYNDAEIGKCTTEGVFSGAFFKPLGGT